jgi:hypothetical protein
MGAMGLETMRLHSYDEFQTWLAKEVEVRDELEALMGTELGVDEGSLDELEAFVLRRWQTPDEALRLEQRGVLDAAARHVGLLMVLTIDGAQWDIDLDDADSVYYRLPVIRFSDGSTDCPITAVTAALDRRAGDFLRTLVEANQELYNSDDEAEPDADADE